MSSKELLFSIPDFLAKIQANKWKILLSAFLGAILLFSWKITKPLKYTAQGIFQSSNYLGGNTQNVLSKILGDNFLNSTLSEGDPKGLLCSETLMREVIKKLNLQGELHTKKERKLFHRIQKNIVMESIFYKAKRKPPLSSLIPKKLMISDDLIPLKHSPFCCSHVFYDKEYYTQLDLVFDPLNHFTIYDQRGKKLGNCKINELFSCDGFQFTLSPNLHIPQKKTSYTLTLLPLKDVALALSKTIKIRKDPENRSLLSISYTSSDRHLATAVVNEVMNGYASILEKENKKIIDEHLFYLKKRHNDAKEDFFSLLDSKKDNIEKNIAFGGFATFAQETEFLAKTQGAYKQKQELILLEMQRLQQSLNTFIHPPSCLLGDQLISQYSKQPSMGFEGISSVEAQRLLAQYSEKLDLNSLQIEEYTHLIEEIPHAEFELSHLGKFLKDSSLESLYVKAHNLQLALLDVKNWSEKEKLRLKEDLETQKTFLIHHLDQLKKREEFQEKILKDKIEKLLLHLLYLYANEYESNKNYLDDLARLAVKFSDQWMLDQEIEFQTQLSTTLIESLAKMIEGKNLSQHLKSYQSRPLVFASLPALPNAPALRFMLFLGASIGAACFVFSLFLMFIFQSPQATLKNLLYLDIQAFGPMCKKTCESWVDEITLFLLHQKKTNIIGFISQENSNSFIIPLLIQKLRQEQKTAEVIYAPPLSSEKTIQSLFPKNSVDVLIVISSSALGSQAFFHLEQSVDFIFLEFRHMLLKTLLKTKITKPWAALILGPFPKRELAFLKIYFQKIRKAFLRILKKSRYSKKFKMLLLEK